MNTRISRRNCLRRIAGAAAAAVTGPALQLSRRATSAAETRSANGWRATIDVLLNEPIRDVEGKPAVISPLLHGHFVEHLGGVVYDGVWVGPESKVPNIDGIRRSLVESFRAIGPPVVRWPGGCFADSYHWRDGIGPPASRPRRFGRWSEATEPNRFGTHEFMRFCRLVGAEPYFGANVGSGSPTEFQQWVEYCNAPAGRTSLADERAANGDADPFKVRFWGIGNENWACGGTFTAEDYCTEYRRFTTWVPSYGVPLYLIACGPTANMPDLADWTRRFMKKWRDQAGAPLHGLSGHYYCGTSGTATEFTPEQWYDLLGKADVMESFIRDTWAAMGEFDAKHTVKFVVDEWGCWHPSGTEVAKGYDFSQTSTLRDALVAGLTLDTFHRHADKLSMCCVAQLINCLQSLYLAVEDRFVRTVNHYVFEMYRDHQNGMAIPVRIGAEPVKYTLDGKGREVFRVAGSASLRQQTLTLTFVHTHTEEPIEIAIRLVGAKAGPADATVLTHKTLNAANTFAGSDEVVPRALRVPAPRPDGQWIITLPPASVTRLRVARA